MTEQAQAPAREFVAAELLQSVVELARYVYGAAASSVFLMSPDSCELVFAAVAGDGEHLVGRRIPGGTGIAGWVAASCQPMIFDDVGSAAEFSRETAESTGYVPTSILAAPLIADGECVGVLEVLDRNVNGPAFNRELDDMALLGLLATQAALSLAPSRRPPAEVGGPARIGTLLERMTEQATCPVNDPLAVALMGVALELMERADDQPGQAGAA